jgi:hypothetical protein
MITIHTEDSKSFWKIVFHQICIYIPTFSSVRSASTSNMIYTKKFIKLLLTAKAFVFTLRIMMNDRLSVFYSTLFCFKFIFNSISPFSHIFSITFMNFCKFNRITSHLLFCYFRQCIDPLRVFSITLAHPLGHTTFAIMESSILAVFIKTKLRDMLSGFTSCADFHASNISQLVRHCTNTAVSDPASGTFRATVIKY